MLAGPGTGGGGSVRTSWPPTPHPSSGPTKRPAWQQLDGRPFSLEVGAPSAPYSLYFRRQSRGWPSTSAAHLYLPAGKRQALAQCRAHPGCDFLQLACWPAANGAAPPLRPGMLPGLWPAVPVGCAVQATMHVGNTSGLLLSALWGCAGESDCRAIQAQVGHTLSALKWPPLTTAAAAAG